MTGKERLYKILTYSSLFLLMFLAQALLFSRLKIFGLILMPIPCAVIALSVIENAQFGVAFGLVCGLMLDTNTGSPLFWYTVFLMLAAFICGRILIQWLRQTLISALLCALVLWCVGECLHTLLFFVLFGRAGIMDLFCSTLPSCLLSFLLAVPFILLFHLSHRRISESCRY